MRVSRVIRERSALIVPCLHAAFVWLNSLPHCKLAPRCHDVQPFVFKPKPHQTVILQGSSDLHQKLLNFFHILSLLHVIFSLGKT